MQCFPPNLWKEEIFSKSKLINVCYLYNCFFQVSADGAYTKSAHDKIGYFTMVLIRAYIVHTPVADSLCQVVTIAVRYSAVRRQSEIEPGYVIICSIKNIFLRSKG